MRLFRYLKKAPRRMDEEGPWERFFRIIIVALLFCGVIWGFWLNSERQLNRLKAPPAPHKNSAGDIRGQVMPPADKQRFLALMQ